MSLRQPLDGRETYLGEAGVRDVPVGEPFEIAAGLASDVTVTRRTVASEVLGSGDNERLRVAETFTLANAKPVAVTFEVRQATNREGFRIAAESRRHVLKDGNDVWRVTIPANGTTSVSYTVEANE